MRNGKKEITAGWVLVAHRTWNEYLQELPPLLNALFIALELPLNCNLPHLTIVTNATRRRRRFLHTITDNSSMHLYSHKKLAL